MRRVRPGCLDVRVLSQATFWVNGEAAVLRVAEMPLDHLQAVAGMLRGLAALLHFWAMIGVIDAIGASELSGVPCGDVLEFAARGSSIADVEARVWLESTSFVREAARLLAGSG